MYAKKQSNQYLISTCLHIEKFIVNHQQLHFQTLCELDHAPTLNHMWHKTTLPKMPMQSPEIEEKGIITALNKIVGFFNSITENLTHENHLNGVSCLNSPPK